MLRRLVVTGLLFLGFAACPGQICQTTHLTDLYCLIPSAFRTTSAPFSAFYTPFGTELSQLPVAKPSGLILKFQNGVLAPTNESLGPVFTDRAETIGRNRVFIGGTFQHFGFNSIDGTKLGNLPIILTYPPPPSSPSVYTVTTNRFDIKASQYAFLAAYGVTNHLDVSVVIPVERIAMSVGVNGVEYSQNVTPLPFTEYVPGSSSGIGDVLLGAKYTVLDKSKIVIAGALNVRVPSGDEFNFLGSGTTGVRPFVVVSAHGRISPHVSLGYQWNGDSILNANTQGQKQQLPTDFFYSVGADGTLGHRFTLVADLLGRHFFNSPRLTSPQSFQFLNVTASTVQPYTSSYTRNDLSLGVKAKVFSNLVVTGNVLIKLDNGGLRAIASPLVGLSYSF
jgi:hypothetical protein